MKGQAKSSRSANPQKGQNESVANSEEPLFFYMPDATHGEFCQWFPSTFTVSKAQIATLIGDNVDDTDTEGTITFSCAEQFMLDMKAGRFKDSEMQKRVLATSSPKEQKRLGKLTASFSDAR